MGDASFGKYRLIAELGHGGMADVFLAVMAGPAGSGFSKLTVIKRLRQNLAEEPEFVEMLVDEARISARLNHPNVVQTNEVGSVGNVYFLAMEYLDGQPFHRIQHRAGQVALKAAAAEKANAEIAKNAAANGESAPSMVMATDPFPRECQYLILLDTLAGLHHAHELADYDGTSLQIVHRDVTPHNVFVTYEGQVKVVDFGIAKAVGRASETRQGVVKGKVRYMAPEQAIGQSVDRRADVFSVGVMLWEAVTGRRLWKDMDDLNIVQALVGGDIKSSPREIDPTVPEELDRICRKALAHSRDERYASAEDFRLDLEQHLAESGKLVSARRKIGPAVAALFDDKRSEIRAVIEKQLHALKGRTVSGEMKVVAIPTASSSGTHPMVLVPPGSNSDEVHQEIPTSITGTGASVDFATGSSASAKAGSASSKGSRRKSSVSSRLPMLAAAGAVAIAVAALAVSRTSLQPAAAKPAPSGSNAEAAREVRVKLTVVPSNAQITIDGAPVPSPYLGTVARDTRDHLVRVEAPGFDPHSEIVRFEGDVTMMVTLTKPAATVANAQAAQAAAQAAAQQAAARWAPPPTTVTKATTSRDPVAAPPPAPPPPTPAALPPASASARNKGPKPDIDLKDPWANH
jgi:eukaryotic-like serine/threonine-protein kinase